MCFAQMTAAAGQKISLICRRLRTHLHLVEEMQDSRIDMPGPCRSHNVILIPKHRRASLSGVQDGRISLGVPPRKQGLLQP
jgi:hypothetical protein